MRSLPACRQLMPIVRRDVRHNKGGGAGRLEGFVGTTGSPVGFFLAITPGRAAVALVAMVAAGEEERRV